MVKIRLTRKGRKNAPSYRIVVADSKAKRDGKFIEIIGYYNPTENPDKVVYKEDRYEYWISTGAQPTKTVKKLVSGNYKYVPYDPNKKEEEASEEVEASTETEGAGESTEASAELTEGAEENTKGAEGKTETENEKN